MYEEKYEENKSNKMRKKEVDTLCKLSSKITSDNRVKLVIRNTLDQVKKVIAVKQWLLKPVKI